MAKGFLKIPDWFSLENQGGGVALADLSGHGQQNVVVFMVDNPPGQNRGLYRIGRNLDVGGNVTGGFTPWIDVPDWFSFENQGASIAVADIDRDGKQDLVVFLIDNPPGQNTASYRVGKALNVEGTVTGGWGPWIAIPDWFSFENQYGAIALADLDGDGSPELIVLMVDNPPGPNRGVYRIGTRLDANGNVTGAWTPWFDVPDWFSWENQGVGVAVADLSGAGKHDLIVFQIDGAVDQNQAFYKIGANLTIDGTIADWANALRILGNEGAHYTGRHVRRDDAEDAFAFAEALLDHIYVLRKRFDLFAERRAKKGRTVRGQDPCAGGPHNTSGARGRHCLVQPHVAGDVTVVVLSVLREIRVFGKRPVPVAIPFEVRRSG